MPSAWSGFLGQPATFNVGVESAATHSGIYAAYISNSGPAPDSTFATIAQYLRPDLYAGRRVRLSAWLRPTGVTLPTTAAAGDPAPVSGIWMRVDGPGEVLAFDNMQSRPVIGTTDWQLVSVVLDVPTGATGISFGVLFSGSGQLLADDVAIDTVGISIPTTSMMTTPVVNSSVSSYQSDPLSPANLDFETVVRHALLPGITAGVKPR